MTAKESPGALGKSLLVLLSFLLLAVIAPERGSASIDYEVGWIEGSVQTSGGEGLAGIRVTASAIPGGGSVWTHTDQLGDYRLELPAGDYALGVAYAGRTFGTAAISVEPGVIVDDERTAFVLRGARVSLQVTRDDEPDPHPSVEISEAVPSCAEGDSCSWWEGDACECSLEGRGYSCWVDECEWFDGGYHVFLQGDENGHMEGLVPEGNYRARVRAGWIEGQSSFFTVDERTFPVVDGEPLAIQVPYDTALLTGTVTVNDTPRSNVRVHARTVGSGVPNGRADAWSVDDGQYSLRLVPGDYEVRPIVDGELGSWMQITVTAAGATLDLAFTSTQTQPATQTVYGTVLVDGEPGAGAMVFLQEAQPDSCELADSCEWFDGDGTDCDGCRIGDREFSCWEGQCWWWDEGIMDSTWTEDDGTWALELPPGNYLLQLRSAHHPGQSGSVIVESNRPVPVEAGSDANVDIEYSTGVLEGTVTHCGEPDASTETRIVALNQGTIWTRPGPSGEYSLRLPVRTYHTELQWRGTFVATGTANVTTEEPANFSADRITGTLTGAVLRDGEGAYGAMVTLTEKQPASCSIADHCDWISSEADECAGCEIGGRRFECWENQCWWWDEGSWVEVYTGIDGTFLAELAPGDYVADVYSAPVPGQSGRVWVGSVEATVPACMMAEIGASGTQVSTGSNVVATLSDGVVLTFDSVSGSGTVSYVATSTPQGGDPPAETIEFLGLFYDFTVTAAFEGMAEVCLPYDPDTIPGSPESLHIYHYEDGQWHELETTPDEPNQRACALTSSFSWYVMGFRHGQPPVADAGDPIDAAAGPNCTARVLLDGSRSHQPGTPDAALAFTWRLGNELLGTGTQLEVDLPLGTHLVTLEVEADGHTHTNTVQVKVTDQTPPQLEVSVTPDRLWPPNGRMVQITSNLIVEDACDPAPVVELASVESPTASAGDIAVSENDVSLRAHRRGNEKLGRTYLLRWVARDSSGNAAEVTATVMVPHDQGS